MKYYSILFNVVAYAILYGFRSSSVASDNVLRCTFNNSTGNITTVYENTILRHSIELLSAKSFTCISTDRKVADILNITKISMTGFGWETENVTVIISVKRLGSAQIRCVCTGNMLNNTSEILTIIVERVITVQEIIFRIIILIFVIVVTFAMGCNIEILIVWSYIKKPIAPTIGLISQYLLMPLLAFGISKLVNLNSEFAFGLLTVGCCPGGFGSNIWTVLLRGDLNLSMTMTFISTILALGMMPFWMFCLGRFFLDFRFISIPYMYMVINLVQVVVPAIVGVLIRWKWELQAMKIIKATRLLVLGFMLFLFTFGIYANWYMYKLIFDYPSLIPIASMLPWLGFLFGFIAGIVTGQGIVRSLTISIEVGIQNIGIAILILKFSMPKPLGDLAAIIPMIVAIVTPFPLMFGYLGDLSIRHCKGKHSKEKTTEVSLSDLNLPHYQMVRTTEAQKQSEIELTMYYCEEPSSYFDDSSPSLG